MEPFFPAFLNKGSQGPAVSALQLALKVWCAAMRIPNTIIIDEDYGNETARVVALLQRWLGFTTENCDGNFGPDTREALKAAYGIDVNSISLEQMQGSTNGVGPG